MAKSSTGMGYPGGLVVKNPPANAGDARDTSSIPGLGRCPGEGNGNTLQYSCLGNPMDRGAWKASPWGCKESEMTEHTQRVKEVLGQFGI